MTIGSSTARVSLACNGVTTVFPIAIQAYQASDIEVIHTTAAGVQTVLNLNSDYSMTAAGSLNPQQWTLTTLAAIPYPTGDTLQAFINPVQQQQTSYVQGQAFPSAAVQANVDRLTQMVQRLQDQVSRSVRAPDGDVSPSMLMPGAEFRESMYLGTDGNGNLILTAALPGTANTASSLGPIIYPQTASEIAASVVPTNYIYAPGRPERYIAPGFAYANATGTLGTDFTAAITTAMSCVIQPVLLGPFPYLFTNLVIPPETAIIGMGLNQTSLVSKAGSGGIVIADNGTSGAKINLFGFSVYCNGPTGGNNTSYTGGMVLGKGTFQYGTEAFIDQVCVRDLPVGVPGFDITSNIGEFGFLQTLNTGGAQFLGSGIFIQNLEVTGPTGFTVSGKQVALNVAEGTTGACEVEGAAAGVINVYFTGNFIFQKLILSLSPSVTYDHLIELGASATSWAVLNLIYYFQAPNATITNGNWKDSSGNFFGGNASAGSHGGEGTFLGGTNLYDYSPRVMRGNCTVGGNLAVTGQFAANGVTPAAAATGFGTATGGAVINNFPGATATLLQTSSTVAELINILITAGLIKA